MAGSEKHELTWEVNFRKAAESYCISCEEFKIEALEFLKSYRKIYPRRDVNLEDLIFVRKRDCNLENGLSNYVSKYPQTTQKEIDDFLALVRPSPKFLVPN